MGQHTWFLKDKELYLKQSKLYDKLDLFENDEIYLDDLELNSINYEIDKISKENDVDDFHDVFRTSKRNSDKTYTDDVIFSRKECFNWLENNSSEIYFPGPPLEPDNNKKHAINHLNKFWDEYPNGVIYFG